jgi:plasmid stabilization system protein ParE
VQLVYLPSALSDMLWFRRYYETIFPDGASGARTRLRATEQLILENPKIGQVRHPSGVRMFPVRRTPFTIYYRLTRDRIEALRIVDQRSMQT